MKGNKSAEKYGFFSKMLPDETLEIIEGVSDMSLLELLWQQILISYAAILRAQRIAYVKNQQDKTVEVLEKKDGVDTKFEVQQAWDKQNNFLVAQARAQAELRNMIKQYDEMAHQNWDLITEEQKARIDVLRAKLQDNTEEEVADDGFLKALEGNALTDWGEVEKDESGI